MINNNSANALYFFPEAWFNSINSILFSSSSINHLKYYFFNTYLELLLAIKLNSIPFLGIKRLCSKSIFHNFNFWSSMLNSHQNYL